MGVNSNSGSGSLSRNSAMPAAEWALFVFARLRSYLGDPFQEILAAERTGDAWLASFLIRQSDQDIEWFISRGPSAGGDVTTDPDLGWRAYCMTWAGGGANVFMHWRRENEATLTSVDTTIAGFGLTSMGILMDAIFGNQCFDVDAAHAKLWDVAGVDLLGESLQLAPARWSNLLGWYPLRDAAAASVENGGGPALVVNGTVIDAPFPALPMTRAAALVGCG